METVEAEPEAQSSPSLEYVRASAPVTRRQFRFLLFLTLLNTILLATFVCGPTISQLTRSTWQQYQTRQRIRQQQQAQNVLLQQAAQYSAPADQIAYEENPIDAAALLNSSKGSTSPLAPHYNPINHARVPWQVPVVLADPPIVARLRAALAGANDVFATLLLHSLKKRNGEERLAWVIIRGDQQNLGVRDYYTPEDLKRPLRQLSFSTKRNISAMILQPAINQPNPAIQTTGHVHLVPDMLDMQSTLTWKAEETSEYGKPTLEPKGVVRFYAGQLDPADSSHFTIDYVYRGNRNTIDVHLEDDDTFVFAPRAGLIVSDQGQTKIWYPFATPATRPSK